MKAIIISGMPAAGKTTVSWILSGKLGLPVIGGGEILKEMAIDRGYKPGGESWWDTPDGIKFLRERETNPDFDKEVDARLADKIRHGNIIVTSYTAPWLSKDGFKVWLDAGEKNRAERMAKRDGSDIKHTISTTKIRDDENYRLYKKLYNMEFGKDKVPFDMVIDTDHINAGQVAELIIKKLRELKIIEDKKA